MKQAVIILIIGGLLMLGLIIYDKKQKELSVIADQEAKESEERAKENFKLVEQEKTIESRVARYWKMSSEEKTVLWNEIFSTCPKARQIIVDQANKWNTSFNEALDSEVHYSIYERNRDPTNYLSLCK